MAKDLKSGKSRAGMEATRRSVLVAGAAAVGGAAISGFPYVSRALAAQTLKFWQFYAPGGGVATQAKWFEDIVEGLERHA